MILTQTTATSLSLHAILDVSQTITLGKSNIHFLKSLFIAKAGCNVFLCKFKLLLAGARYSSL